MVVDHPLRQGSNPLHEETHCTCMVMVSIVPQYDGVVTSGICDISRGVANGCLCSAVGRNNKSCPIRVCTCMVLPTVG